MKLSEELEIIDLGFALFICFGFFSLVLFLVFVYSFAFGLDFFFFLYKVYISMNLCTLFA